MAVFGSMRGCWKKPGRHGAMEDLARNKAGRPAQRLALYSEAIFNLAQTPGLEPERRPQVGDGGRGGVRAVGIVVS